MVVRRDGTRLWYSANMAALEELLVFLYSECCIRNRVFSPDVVAQVKSLWGKVPADEEHIDKGGPQWI